LNLTPAIREISADTCLALRRRGVDLLDGPEQLESLDRLEHDDDDPLARGAR
jgi:hypothetical protein